MAEVVVHLAHGASSGAESMLRHVRGLRARGVAAQTVQLPRGKAERAVPAYLAAVPPGTDAVIGGHSYGGRVASLAAADHEYAGLVLLSYPLHAPGAPERWDERTSHWTRIACPVLLLSGDRDPFARMELLRDAVQRLPRHELVVYPGVRHGIGPVLDDALDRIVAFVRALPTGP
ncbi:MAG: alpha/beta hydrolase family protein [Candidatus Limnocylindria bacterium]